MKHRQDFNLLRCLGRAENTWQVPMVQVWGGGHCFPRHQHSYGQDSLRGRPCLSLGLSLSLCTFPSSVVPCHHAFYAGLILVSFTFLEIIKNLLSIVWMPRSLTKLYIVVLVKTKRQQKNETKLLQNTHQQLEDKYWRSSDTVLSRTMSIGVCSSRVTIGKDNNPLNKLTGAFV